MGKGKELDVSDLPSAEEWMDIPEDWKNPRQRQSVSRKGNPITWVHFDTPSGEQQVPDFALRREKGKNFRVLIRWFNDNCRAEDPATG